jgi:transposase InsO family protein
MWGSDGTKIQTVDDVWVWVFSVTEHWNSECMGWHVCKTGDRFAALEPVMQAVKARYGALSKEVANLQQLACWGIQSSFGLVRQPETNGVAERFHRTLKDQILDGRAFRNVDEVREAVGQFVQIYNEQWLVAKRGHQSSLEARRNHEKMWVVA